MSDEDTGGRLAFEIAGRPARGPADAAVYAIGDVHGRADLLHRMWDLIEEDAVAHGCANRIEILLGDLIDRGPDSAGVVEAVVQRAKTRAITVLRGNHEQYVRDALRGTDTMERWLAFGGGEALRSYGVDAGPADARRPLAEIAEDLRRALPATHRAFIAAIPDHVRHGDFLFVHAGIRPGIPLEQQDPVDLVTIRQGFLDDDTPHGFIVVHGHTPLAAPEIRRNRIGIDTKAWDSGRLTALVIAGEELRLLGT